MFYEHSVDANINILRYRTWAGLHFIPTLDAYSNDVKTCKVKILRTHCPFEGSFLCSRSETGRGQTENKSQQGNRFKKESGIERTEKEDKKDKMKKDIEMRDHTSVDGRM